MSSRRRSQDRRTPGTLRQKFTAAAVRYLTRHACDKGLTATLATGAAVLALALASAVEDMRTSREVRFTA